MGDLTTSAIEWGVAMRPRDGESDSGDGCVVHTVGDTVLVGTVDGLGHGRDAAVITDLVVQTLGSFADEHLVALVERCHRLLRGTRGAVMSLARFDSDGELTWLSIGNIEGLVIRSIDAGGHPDRNEWLAGAPGIVGHRLPPLRPATLHVERGDTILFLTDGIDVSADFASVIRRTDLPRQIADRVLAARGKREDDALVFVSRYVGGHVPTP
ncbi:MAG TPA: SpoIIE family protein phosphatase [Vicinamibacterales bacterium]|nr:SpoIIE family protein phosphatase [Vicinamibacterales bacterium]